MERFKSELDIPPTLEWDNTAIGEHEIVKALQKGINERLKLVTKIYSDIVGKVDRETLLDLEQYWWGEGSPNVEADGLPAWVPLQAQRQIMSDAYHYVQSNCDKPNFCSDLSKNRYVNMSYTRFSRYFSDPFAAMTIYHTECHRVALILQLTNKCAEKPEEPTLSAAQEMMINYVSTFKESADCLLSDVVRESPLVHPKVILVPKPKEVTFIIPAAWVTEKTNSKTSVSFDSIKLPKGLVAGGIDVGDCTFTSPIVDTKGDGTKHYTFAYKADFKVSKAVQDASKRWVYEKVQVDLVELRDAIKAHSNKKTAVKTQPKTVVSTFNMRTVGTAMDDLIDLEALSATTKLTPAMETMLNANRQMAELEKEAQQEKKKGHERG